MTTLLDALKQLIVDGQGVAVTFIEVEETCTYPHFAATTSYRRGCRCNRCRAGQKEAQRRSDARSYERSHLANRYTP